MDTPAFVTFVCCPLFYETCLLWYTSEFDSTVQVAALSGDARRALDICRRATELAEQDESESSQMVTMTHVDVALQEMYTAPKIVAIRYAQCV